MCLFIRGLFTELSSRLAWDHEALRNGEADAVAACPLSRDERTTGARGGCAVITSIIVSSCSCNLLLSEIVMNERPSF